MRAVLRPGQEVTLLDVSRASLRLAAPIPLRPGRRVELQLRREDGRHQAAGLIVWCQLALLAPATYHAAIALDDPLPAG